MISRIENDELRKDIEVLKGGGQVEKQLNDNIIFQELYSDEDMIFSFLVASGYLNATKIKGKNAFLLQIPNQEIFFAFELLSKGLLKRFVSSSHIKALIRAIFAGDTRTFEVILNKALLASSSFDVAKNYEENSYHMYLLGLLCQYNNNYTVLSNREFGYGRYDICIMEHTSKKAVILELKRALDDSDELDQLC